MTDYPESFANYPESISTIKSAKSKCMDDWSPRDAIIDVLRYIDNLPKDVTVNAAIIVFQLSNEDGEITKFTQSGPNPSTTLGMLEIAKFRMLTND